MQFNYSIPTCFVQRFQLEQIVSDLPKSHPNIIIQTHTATSPTRVDYKKFGELVDKVKSLPGSADSSLKAIVDKLKEVAKVLHKEQNSLIEDPKNFDPTKAPGKIAHNTSPNSCYAAVLLNTLRDEFFKEKLAAHPEMQLIISCIDKINQGSKTHLIGSDQGVVSVDEIATIQKILSDRKLIKLDKITDQDPMEVLCNLLQSICPNFSLFEGKEINHYHLQQINNPEEVILSESQLGPNGDIVVDQEGKTYKNLAGITIPLNSLSATIHLDEAFENYLDDKQPSEKSTVYVKTDKGTYLKYSGVTHQTTRTLSKPPERLFLETSGHSKKTIFKEKISLKTDDSKEHYYVLQQINCHLEVGQFKHEYAYLNHDSGWFLSDDLRPINRVFLKVKSNDVNDICSHGRVFIYKKVDLETFKKISNTEYSFFKPMVPKEKVNFSLEPYVLTQLKELNTICQRLASKQASLQDLFELSWGVANLPKECKFSKVWLTYISESNWLLLEDISRQLSLKYPNHPELSDFHTKESMKQFVQPFFNTAKQLANVFESLQKNLSQTSKPTPLEELENLFYDGFDEFILNHAQKAVKTIQDAHGSKDPLNWLKEDENHFKALFRVIEIIGEAAKVVSKKTKQKLPFLSICSKDDKGLLWGRIRNQLHHKKSRSWDIARLAPEKWALIISKLLSKVTSEVSQESPTDEDLKHLEELLQCLDQNQYNEIRKDWRKLEQSDFEQEPLQLKKILFGFELTQESDFDNIWETHAKPFLRPNIDETKNKSSIHKLFLIGQKKYILPSDIEKLADSSIAYSKNNAVTKLKELLAAIKSDNDFKKNKHLAEAFEEITRQFVFLKKKDAKNLIRDAQQNKKLKTVVSLKLSQIKTVQFTESFFTEYGNTFEAFINLKQGEIADTTERLQTLLKAVRADWPDEISESSVNTYKKTSHPSDPKRGFHELWDKLVQQSKFINAQDLEELKNLLKDNLLSFRKQLPETVSQLTLEKLKQDKEKCFSAINKLERFLTNKCNSSFIKEKATERLHEAVVLFQDVKSTPENIDKIKKIFERFAFPVNTDLKMKLKSHNLTDDSLDLSKLSSSVINYLDAQTEKDLNLKIDGLVKDAENELGIAFVQKVLKEGKISGKFGEFPFQTQLSVLGDICRGSETGKRNWENFVRKIEGRRLNADQMEEIIDPSVNSTEQPLKDLKDYLNGNKSFDLDKETPRFEHGNKKVEIFTAFLHNECFPMYPKFENKKDLIIRYFKIANRIVDNKAEAFSKYFVSKISKLGTIFSEILKEEQLPTAPNRKGILSLAGEYEMQDIGELAQLITDRPALWDQGRHMLSSQHLMYISLLRKMMAHYPLSLTPELLRWNLEYLSFDTPTMLSRNSGSSLISSLSVKSTVKRRLISWKDIRDKRLDIDNYLDSMSLSLTIDILYPSLHVPENEHLHWLGDLTLMVYPKAEMKSKEEFIHAVMELELILSFEFQAKVCVIGKWNDEHINRPCELNTPKATFNTYLEKKQSLSDWELSMRTYSIFLNEPWTKIYLKSGQIIQKNDYELYQGWKFFFEILELKDPSSLKNFLEMSNLSWHIYNCLKKHKPQFNYSKSDLFKWVYSLFEKFPVPGVSPLQLICFPKINDDERPITAIIDTTYHSLLSLPYSMNTVFDHVPDSEESEIQPYYKEGVRLDFYNGRSVIESSQALTDDELIALSEYAADVLTFHSQFIIDRFQKRYQLDRSQFVDVEGIAVDDPGLIKEAKPIEDISNVKTLIESEAKSLSNLIVSFIHRLYEEAPSIYKQMLKWMRVDKEIEIVAAEYYGKNRLRLKGPYIQMDSLSRKIFDAVFINSEGHKWSHFPFVNSFRQFVTRIHLEAHSLVNLDFGQINVTGDYGKEFKQLVPEIDIQQKLLELMKKREHIMAFFYSSVYQKKFLIAFIPNGINFFELYAILKLLNSWKIILKDLITQNVWQNFNLS